MENGDIPTIKHKALRHYGFVMAFAVVGLLLIAGGDALYARLRHASTISEVTSSSISQDGVSVRNLPRSAPVRLVIPSINLDATFVSPLALQDDLTVSVPDSYTEVGWYSGGAAPGEIGSTVILGHVDSKSGPAVFFSLGQVRVGDTIQLTREDGVVVAFTVTELRRYLQSEFPSESVYGSTAEPTLKLVTCTGLYDRGEKRYSHNLVVYGSFASSTKPLP